MTVNGERKVIALRGCGELHGYLVSADEKTAKVLWATASGRRRTAVVAREDLSFPRPEHPWEGVEIAA